MINQKVLVPPVPDLNQPKRLIHCVHQLQTQNFSNIPNLKPSNSLPWCLQEMCELIPNDQQHLSARMERRNQLLMGLAKLKKEHQDHQSQAPLWLWLLTENVRKKLLTHLSLLIVAPAPEWTRNKMNSHEITADRQLTLQKMCQY